MMGWCRSTTTEVIGGARVAVAAGRLADRLASGRPVTFVERTFAPRPECFDLPTPWKQTQSVSLADTEAQSGGMCQYVRYPWKIFHYSFYESCLKALTITSFIRKNFITNGNAYYRSAPARSLQLYASVLPFVSYIIFCYCYLTTVAPNSLHCALYH